MNEYLYIVRPTRVAMLTDSTAEEDRIVGEHFAYLRCHAEDGTLLLAGRTQTTEEQTLGIAIYRAASDAAAHEFAARDPAVRAGVMSVEVLPYRVALLSATYPRDGLRTTP